MMFEFVIKVGEFSSPSCSSGVGGVILFERNQGLVVCVDGKPVAVFKVVAELKDSPYHCETFLFGGGPVNFVSIKGASCIGDGMLFSVCFYLMDGCSNVIV